MLPWKSLLLPALYLASAAWLHATEPIGFEELSLLVRSGEAPQSIVAEATRRRLLMGLTPTQEAKLQASGASPALIAALRAPALLASPEELQTYLSRRKVQAQVDLLQTRATAKATPAPRQAVVLPDHFTEYLEAAKSAPTQSLAATDAFSLEQLATAEDTARTERKPLGFIVTSKKCFGQACSTRQMGTFAAALHLHEAFKDSLVLVFIPQETDPNRLPPAVQKGMKAAKPKAAPTMAVVDATASELIVEIASGGAKDDGPARDALFKTGAAKIQQWLTYHPTALAQQGAVSARR